MTRNADESQAIGVETQINWIGSTEPRQPSVPAGLQRIWAYNIAAVALVSWSRRERSASGYLFPLAQLNSSTASS